MRESALNPEEVGNLARHVQGSLKGAGSEAGLALLSSRAEDFVLSCRVLGQRNWRWQAFERNGDLFSADGLDLLREALAAEVENPTGAARETAADASGRAEESGFGAGVVGSVGLVALHSARMDWHFDGAREVHRWMGRHLSPAAGEPTLRVADESIKFGEAAEALCDDPGSNPSLPAVSDLERLGEDLRRRQDSQISGDANPWPRLRLWLIESISAMPASWLADCDRGGPYRELALGLSGFSEWARRNTPPPPAWAGRPQLSARAAYVASQMQYAAGRLDTAQLLLRFALRATDGSDLTFIERCQTRLMFLDQEHASRQANETHITELVDGNARRRFAEFESSAEQAMVQIANEGVRESTLRVVEILGLFVAVAGIVGTSLGGAFAAETWGAALIVYGAGLAGVAVLVALMLWVVNRSRQRVPRERPDRGRDMRCPT